MKDQINRNLDDIERKYQVKIILACESGSRAWGFPSNDSDYDVRFIYVNQKDWYLSIFEKRDIIEIPVDKVLDINGWDLRKALKLLRKSNSPLLEWLSSPIQYRVWNQAFEPILKISKLAFLSETSCCHYLSMAKNSISEFDHRQKIKIKTYMYAIRPLLCCQWIINYLKQPPMRMAELLSGLEVDNRFEEIIYELMDVKNKNTEKHMIERVDFIESHLHEKVSQLKKMIPKNPLKTHVEEFDKIFRDIISMSNNLFHKKHF